jgi:hypothetical protein
MKLSLSISCAAILMLSVASNADTRTDAINYIISTSDRICHEIPIDGHTKTVSINAEAKAETSALVKQLADMGVKVAVDTVNVDYSNVLQKDLAGAIADENECKEKWANRLIDIFFPPMSDAQKKS